jgi:hypothetical protein
MVAGQRDLAVKRRGTSSDFVIIHLLRSFHPIPNSQFPAPQTLLEITI